MDGFQRLLDRINRRFGAVGSALAVAFWVVVLFFILRAMIFQM